MSPNREAKYAQALDDLDARRASGAVSPNAYDLERPRLLKEASREPWHWGFQLAAIVGIIIAFLILIRIAGAFVNAMNGT